MKMFFLPLGEGEGSRELGRGTASVSTTTTSNNDEEKQINFRWIWRSGEVKSQPVFPFVDVDNQYTLPVRWLGLELVSG